MDEKKDKKALGRLGEQLAGRFLEEQGLVILDRNWRCRSGEIDLIVQEGNVVVFVEVRSRSTINRFGTPQESVNRPKKLQVRRIAEYYLYVKKLNQMMVRFDVIAIHLSYDGVVHNLEHIQHAF